jgi:PAS domain S-box-containing protein
VLPHVARILEGVSDACVVLDRDWKYVYVNARAGKLFARAPEQLVGKHIWTEFPEGVDQEFYRAYYRAVDTQQFQVLEAWYPPWDRWFENRIYPSPEGLVIFFQDITERKRDEERARQGARVRAKAEEMAHFGAWEWNAESNHVEWSDELYRIYGLDHDTFGASFEAYLQRVHPDDRPRVRATIERALREKTNVTFDERIVRADGGTRYLHSWAGIRTDEKGQQGLVGACLDTTELFEATTELRRSQAWLRAAMEAADIGLWEWDILRNTVTWSRGVERLFGISAGAFSGTYDAYLRLVHPDDRERVDSTVRASLARGAEYEVLHRVLASDGSTRWIEGRGRVLTDEQGRRVRMTGSVADVTHRHALEEGVRQSQKMEAIGRLAAGVAHDFNNLLTVILTVTDLLSHGSGLDESARLGVNEIVGAAKRASVLTRQLLALSRQQSPSVEAIDLNDIIDSSATMLRRLLPEDVHLNVELEPKLWSVRGDAGQIEQVLLNLVVNARDAMPDGGEIRIATRNDGLLRTPTPHGPFIVLSVSDTGTGMTAETRARVFEPFFTTKPVGEGTGLGLTMVYGIIRQLGGTIEVDTAPGRGTTFTLKIPAQPTALEITAASAPRGELTGVGETVLLVDDQDAIRRTLGRLLKSMGYRVVEASDAASALGLVDSPETGHVDVLLTDVGMPGMNGVELAKELRASHPDLGVVFMSGYAEGAPQGFTGPRIASVAKPFSSSEISAVLRGVISPESVHAR